MSIEPTESIVLERHEEPMTAGEALIAQVVARATPERVPSGLLHRCRLSAPLVRELDGSERATACRQREWIDVYQELETSWLHGPRPRATASVVDAAAGYAARGQVPIVIAALRYEILRARFWARVHERERDAERARGARATLDGGDAVAALDEKDIIESREAFFAAALLPTEYEVISPLPHVHRGLEVSFVLPADGYLTNIDEALLRVEADFGRGTGFEPIEPEAAVSVPYAEPGVKRVTLRCTTSRGVRLARFDLEVALPAPVAHDDRWPLTASRPFGGIKATGQAWIFRGLINGVKKAKITQPVIVAEGFPGGYSIAYLWERLNQQGLADALLRDGYDIIVLGFDAGTLPIQANAFLAVDCIQKVISQRSGNGPLVVGGASMGGLITRYALAYMESNGLDHQTIRYFSIDTPHRGAVIPLAAQCYLQYMAGVSDGARDAAALLQSDAAQQMLLAWVPPYKNWTDGLVVSESPKRAAFLDDLRVQGWMPRKCRSAGVSDGVGTGAESEAKPGEKAVWQAISLWFWADLFVHPRNGNQNIVDMKCNKVDKSRWTLSGSQAGHDGAPGGLSDVFKRIYDSAPNSKWLWYGRSCFVPTPSACAIQKPNLYQPIKPTDESDLGSYKYSSVNLMHVDLSAELATYLGKFIRGADIAAEEPGEGAPEAAGEPATA